MVELFLVVLVAIVVGIIAGLVPGIGKSMIILSAYPVLSTLPLYYIFLFYIVLDSTMQYYGSISSIVFGILGETTSAPAVENGHELFRRGHSDDILTATATSSFIASLVGILVFWLCAEFSPLLIVFLTGKVKAIVLGIVLLILIFISSNKLLSFLLVLVGLFMGAVGSYYITWPRGIFPQYSIFDAGIPFAPLLTGFIVLPTLIMFLRTPVSIVLDASKFPAVTTLTRLKYLMKMQHFFSTLRGSIIGSICGAIPGVSYSISSSMAESVEKILNKRKTDDASLTKNLLSAEAANNAGAIVVLAPLLLFMIPIVSSEALILSLAESNGLTYLAGMEFVQKNLMVILATLIGINIVNWTVSGYFYRYIVTAYYSMNKYGYWIALVTCTLITIVSGYTNFQFLYTIYVLCVSLVLGLLINNFSAKMALVFAFFVSNELLIEVYRQYLYYFT